MELEKTKPEAELNKESIRKEILEEASKCVLTNRNAIYAGPEKNFSRIAQLANCLFSEKLSTPLTSVDVALFSVCIKLSRIQETPDHKDSWIDLAGYAACGAECAISGNEDENAR